MTEHPHHKHHKVDKELKYRWGPVFIIATVCIMVWYLASTSWKFTEDPQRPTAQGLVKVTCPRCQNELDKVKSCQKCGGTGAMWVTQTEAEKRQK